jgi:glycosyltransferase involved in cell wall biosynthesis
MMPYRPLVSIVLLSYDRAAYLRRALDSALAQSYAPIEVIVADDCSPDPAVDRTLQGYAGDLRVVYERPERNVGVVANLLRAVERARGTYVSIVCDDDELEATFVERLVAPLEADRSLIVSYCSSRIIDAAGRIDAAASAEHARRWKYDRLKHGVQQPFIAAALLDRSLQPAMGALFRRSAIAWPEFSAQAGGAWDLWLGYLACRDGGAAFHVAEPLLRYRHHGGMLTVRRDVGWHRGQVANYEGFLCDQRLARWRGTFQRRLANYHLQTGMALLRQACRDEARTHFRAVRRAAFLPKAALGLALSHLPEPMLSLIFAEYARLRARLRTVRLRRAGSGAA